MSWPFPSTRRNSPRRFCMTPGLKAGTSNDLELLQRTFKFATAPYGVALVRGHQKATVDVGVFETDGQPAALLHGLGFIDVASLRPLLRRSRLWRGRRRVRASARVATSSSSAASQVKSVPGYIRRSWYLHFFSNEAMRRACCFTGRFPRPARSISVVTSPLSARIRTYRHFRLLLNLCTDSRMELARLGS